MSRRSAPLNSGPAYISHNPHLPGGPKKVDPNETPFARFMREQIHDPTKRQGNLSLLRGVGMFVGGIVVVRLWGDLMIPA